MMSGAVVLCLLLFNGAFAQDKADIDSLRLVQAIWRHGDRAPAGTFPTDTDNTEASWPQGWGELTTIGMNMHYKQGQYLRERYDGFLSSRYDAFEVYVRSTDYNRTIMSAMCNMAGLFPPSGDQQWNADLNWQPVPIHVVPDHHDKIGKWDFPCKVADDLWNAAMAYIYNKYYAEDKEFIDMVWEKTGFTHLPGKSFFYYWLIGDPQFILGVHGRPRVDWMTDDVYNKVLNYMWLAPELAFSVKEISRLRGGQLTKEMIKRMKDKATGNSDPRFKFYVYSSHDFNTLSLLSNLKVYSGPWVPYAAMLLMELHERDGQHFVELHYRNDTTNWGPSLKLEIPFCPPPCKLEDLEAKANVPNDWEKECNGEAHLYDEGSGPCEKHRAELFENGFQPGTFLPHCTNTGLYQSRQCDLTIPACFCVTPENGEEIQGTRSTDTVPDCDHKGEDIEI